jgi:hypothetical protein
MMQIFTIDLVDVFTWARRWSNGTRLDLLLKARLFSESLGKSPCSTYYTRYVN